MQKAPLVFHVLPFDLARGAQIYARALRDTLDGPCCRHRIVTLFTAIDAVLDADHALDVTPGWPGKLGLDPRALVRLHDLIRVAKPAVIVAHGSQPLKYCNPVAAAQSYDLPVVAFRIGISALRSGLKHSFFTRQLAAASTIVGVSSEVLDESVKIFGADPARCRLIPNGRDPQVYRPGDRGEARLAFVGHYDTNKRPELVVSVVEALRKRGVEFSAVMIGDGPLLEAVRPRAERAGIEVLGRRSDVPELLRACSLFLLVSKMEGMPGVFIEAGLSGLATITTDVPGAHRVIEDGVTGHIVPQEDLPGLIDRAEVLLRDGEHAAAMGDAARKRCVEHFSLVTGARLWDEVLQPFVERARG